VISTPGITGVMRKVADEKRLVDRHVLVRMDGLARLALEHAIDQKEGIAMRQMLQNCLDIHCVQVVFSLM
jgi:hypothetical protein